MNAAAIEKQSDEVREQEAREQGLELVKLDDPMHDRPWFVARQSDHARVSERFASRAEALNSLPNILLQNARHLEADKQGYRDEWDCIGQKWYLSRYHWVQRADGGGFKHNSPERSEAGGPFESQEEALDALPQIIRETREREEQFRLRGETARVAVAKIPAAYLRADLEKLTEHREAVEIAREFVDTFALRAIQPAQGLIFAGEPGQGKTRLACWIAEELARTGSRTRYTTVDELFRAQRYPDIMPELAYPELLVLDWDGIETIVDDKAVQRLAERMALDTVPHITGLLDARVTVPTILVADCDIDRLWELIGVEASLALQRRSWKIVSFEKAK